MSPNLWLSDLIPKEQTSSRENQVLSLEEQINAWYSVNQKMAWGIRDVVLTIYNDKSIQK